MGRRKIGSNHGREDMAYQRGSYAGCSCGKYLHHSRFTEHTVKCECGRAWPKADIAHGAQLRQQKQKKARVENPRGQSRSNTPWLAAELRPRRRVELEESLAGEATPPLNLEPPDPVQMFKTAWAMLQVSGQLAPECAMPVIAAPMLPPEKPAEPLDPQSRMRAASKAFNVARHECERELAANTKAHKRLELARAEVAEAQSKYEEYNRKYDEAKTRMSDANKELDTATQANDAHVAERARLAAEQAKGPEFPAASAARDNSSGDGAPQAKRPRAHPTVDPMWEALRDHCINEVQSGGTDELFLQKCKELFAGVKEAISTAQDARTHMDVETETPVSPFGTVVHQIGTPSGASGAAGMDAGAPPP